MATGRGSHTYVLVLYDYDYVADDGSPVSIKKDEEYVLLKKANKDWWHVANLHAKANGEKPFYVPAAYVEEIYKNVISVGPGEIRETIEDVQRDATVTVNEDQVTTIKVGYDQEPEPDYPGDPPDLHPKTPKPNEDLDNNNMKDFSFQEDSDSVRVKQSPQIVRQKSAPPEVPQKPQRRYEDPTYANLEEVRVAAGMDRPLSQVSQSSDLSQDSPDSDRDYANYRPGSLSPFSTFAISPPSPSLVPNNPMKNLDYGWEEHLDETTGRTYYYNVHTRQTSWNPPRVRARIRSHSDAVFTARQRLQLNTSRDSAFSSDFSPASPVSPHSPSISPLRPSTLSSKSASLPRGWKQEVNDGGEVTFVNDGLGEKWLCSQDDQGRTYYYKEDGSESAWELPEMPKLDYERQFSNDSQPDEREFSADLDPTDQHGGSGGARRPSAPVGPGEVSQSPRQRVLMRTSTLPNHSHRPSFLHLVSSRLEESDYSHRKKGPAPQPPKPPEKRGYLKVTKIMDGNKKLKKNWSQIFIVLTGPKLFFYKDTKSAVGQQGKPDQEFEVGKMDVEWAGKEVSSKKNTIQLSCTVDLELQQYLLQQDDQGVMQEWHSDISKAIKRFRPRPAESLQHSTSFKKSATLPATLQSNESYDSVQMRPISARGRFQSSSKSECDAIDKSRNSTVTVVQSHLDFKIDCEIDAPEIKAPKSHSKEVTTCDSYSVPEAETDLMAAQSAWYTPYSSVQQQNGRTETEVPPVGDSSKADAKSSTDKKKKKKDRISKGAAKTDVHLANSSFFRFDSNSQSPGLTHSQGVTAFLARSTLPNLRTPRKMSDPYLFTQNIPSVKSKRKSEGMQLSKYGLGNDLSQNVYMKDGKAGVGVSSFTTGEYLACHSDNMLQGSSAKKGSGKSKYKYTLILKNLINLKITLRISSHPNFVNSKIPIPKPHNPSPPLKNY
ncbi:rho GTPase-activating protein 12-like [Lingula anatina]|uniref:Rho GTPase-activating protein 12-like n=1 Tax=Lingula anatina TaxID=7574 RepID=A0A1S3I4F2_LINAN|nr:rho GTPase-activating protein 12-like [Lingula anatina]|eukprot:XP_013393142.1 rho GTPase-activating protein 12-like [Lingula anatina]